MHDNRVLYTVHSRMCIFRSSLAGIIGTHTAEKKRESMGLIRLGGGKQDGYNLAWRDRPARTLKHNTRKT